MNSKKIKVSTGLYAYISNLKNEKEEEEINNINEEEEAARSISSKLKKKKTMFLVYVHIRTG